MAFEVARGFSVVAIQALQRASAETKQNIWNQARAGAQGLVSALQRQYPVRDARIETVFPPGELRRRVGVREIQGVGFMVRSFAPHVHFYEAGTKPRKDPTRKNAYRGKSLAHNVFIPSIVRERRGYLSRAESILNASREIG
jgi:hypothetical protein